jgi:hypothetical protein
MKYALALLLICAQLTTLSQKDSLTLYAYEQKVIPGIAPARNIDEEGNVIRQPAGTKNQYYIYLTAPGDIAVYPVSLWIKGKLYGINVKDAASPVKCQAANDSTIILVPETKQRTFRLFPIPCTQGKEQKGAALAKQNEVVLVYKLKGRFHNLVREKIKRLDAVHLQ